MTRLATGESVLTYGWKSDVGLVRKENQDACGKFPADSWDLDSDPGQLFIIADGMGGLDHGARASKYAVERISSILAEAKEGVTAQDCRNAFITANTEIFDLKAGTNGDSRMGTTCTLLYIHGTSATVCHVGDSRLYRINARGIVQLTQDHSNVAEMQRRGILTEAEAAVHPEKSKLYKALGPHPEIEPDVIDNLTLTTEDYFVLCTDGLHNKVRDEEIHREVLRNPPDKACAKLAELAKERGGEDNITVQVVHIKRQANFLERVFKRPLRKID